MDKQDFAGDNGYIVTTWDAQANAWRYRPVVGGAPLTRAEIAALGLDAPSPGRLPPVAFSQRDPRWASVSLGGSAYTMGSAGCAVTACAMVASVVQPALTPLDLVTWLNANGGFTSGGLLYWAKVAEAVGGLTFVNYYLWRAVAADLAALTRALLNGPQVVQVDFQPSTTALDTHFVTAVAMTADGLDVQIIDPWTGTAGTLLGMYAKQGWTLARAVYALAEFAF